MRCHHFISIFPSPTPRTPHARKQPNHPINIIHTYSRVIIYRSFHSNPSTANSAEIKGVSEAGKPISSSLQISHVAFGCLGVWGILRRAGGGRTEERLHIRLQAWTAANALQLHPPPAAVARSFFLLVLRGWGITFFLCRLDQILRGKIQVSRISRLSSRNHIKTSTIRRGLD